MLLAQTYTSTGNSLEFHTGPFGVIWGLVSLGFAIFLLVDVLRHPEAQWQQAGQNRGLWIGLAILSFFCCGLIIAIVYLIAVRPKLQRAGIYYSSGPPPTGMYGQDGYPPVGGYPPQTGYPTPGGYPPQTGYPPPGGYPPAGGFAPPPPTGYPPPAPPPADGGWGQPQPPGAADGDWPQPS